MRPHIYDRFGANSLSPINIQNKNKFVPGQIVRGKILKLYPNQRAKIQLGGKPFIAQLKAQLTIGKSYHFQIEQLQNDIMHLKILSQIGNDELQSVKNMLHHINIEASRKEVEFVQSLLADDIPIQASPLKRAIYMMRTFSNRNYLEQTLKQMLFHHIPINEQTLTALHTLQTTNFNTLYQEAIHSKDREMNVVRRLLQNVFDIETTSLQEAIQQIANDKDRTRSVLKTLAIIEQTDRSGITLPKQITNIKSIDQLINNLLVNKDLLLSRSIDILNQSGHMKNQTTIIQLLNDQILPLLTPKHQQSLYIQLQEHFNDKQYMYQFLQSLSSEQTFNILKKLQSLLKYQFSKQHFLGQLHVTMNELGLSYENMIAKDQLLQVEHTVKHALLQIVQKRASNDQVLQLLHFINGMQLQSLHETNHLIQANLFLLGEPLGLKKDVHLKFQGKKSDRGEINPDFCRILFFLDLAALKETVIDMNIQQRFISLTIFHQAEDIHEWINIFQPMLADGLSQLNYQLTNITCRRLEEQKKHLNRIHYHEEKTYKRFDVKI